MGTCKAERCRRKVYHVVLKNGAVVQVLCVVLLKTI